MSELKNPMRFSMSSRTVDIERWLQPVGDDCGEKRVTEIDLRPSEGNIYVHWEGSE